jgi:GrpB-like predicted nucleotidyltransferase (UPF0157 family)
VAVDVVPYRDEWPVQFDRVAGDLRRALRGLQGVSIEHVGSTSVPGLAAKPILDIDIIVPPGQVAAAIAALEVAGYVHRGDFGVTGREAFAAPEDTPRRHVYVCPAGGLQLRNHLAVRDVLRQHPELAAEYAAVKMALAAQPDIDIDAYIAGKSDVLQRVLALSQIVTDEEREQIRQVNAAVTGTAGPCRTGNPAEVSATGDAHE